MSEDHKLAEISTQPHDNFEVDHHSELKREDQSHEPEQNIVQKDDKEEGHEISKEDDDDDDDDCKTPCLEENKIPGAQSCPPAPSRKRREEQAGLSHKRKLFFEHTDGGAEEIESLFQNSSSTVNEVSRVSSIVKRRRKS